MSPHECKQCDSGNGDGSCIKCYKQFCDSCTPGRVCPVCQGANAHYFKSMTPKQESALVPDWVVCHPSGGYGDVVEEITVDAMDCEDGIRAYVDGPTLAQLTDLLPALAFFAATGRLPRRLSDGGAV